MAGSAHPRVFLLDVNAALDMGERFYPQDVFGGVWARLIAAMAEGKIRFIRRAISELVRLDDQPWRGELRVACEKYVEDEGHRDIQAIFARVARNGVSRRIRDVELLSLACAEARSWPVVTHNGMLVDACERGHLSAQTVSIATMFRELGWTFP